MTCINIGSGHICTQNWGRLHVMNKYIMVEFHPYCGPAFYTDRKMTKSYDPVDENDPVWDKYEEWQRKRSSKN